MSTSPLEHADVGLPVLEAIEPPGSDEPTSESLQRQLAARRQRHGTMLLAAMVVVVLALMLEVAGDERVTLGGIPLPPTCASRSLFDVDCPGCGLTRSFVLLAHGDWTGAWRMHRLGWLLAMLTLVQFPYRIAALRFPDRELLGTLFPKLVGYLLIGLLIGNWLLNLLSRVAA